MDPGTRDEFLLALFRRLRALGLALGVGELMAARRALDGGFGAAGDDSLKGVLRLLWCKSEPEQATLDSEAARLMSVLASSGRDSAARSDRSAPLPLPAAPAPPPPPAPRPPSSLPASVPKPTSPAPASEPGPAAVLRPLPVRTPVPAQGEIDPDLAVDHPVTRRTMAYTWRYLRRPVKDGPCDRVDLPATVARAARQGFFDRPVLARRTTDHGHLILLIDQGGSMVPFHRLTRDLVETARDSGLGRVDLAWFQNVPPDYVYLDPHRTRPIPRARFLNRVQDGNRIFSGTDACQDYASRLGRGLGGCTAETRVLLVSDAGAARGGSEPRRVQATARVLAELRRLTAAVAWLNPVPRTRWPGTSAALIGRLVAMYPMDKDGFGQAVEVLRGQSGWGYP